MINPMPPVSRSPAATMNSAPTVATAGFPNAARARSGVTTPAPIRTTRAANSIASGGATSLTMRKMVTTSTARVRIADAGTGHLPEKGLQPADARP